MTVDEAQRIVRKNNAIKGKINRREGELFEFDVLNTLKERAILAVRSAGSHSDADIVAVFKKKTWLISCKKNGYLTQSERDSLRQLRSKLSSNYEIVLAWRDSGKKIRFQEI